jgi:predicted nucleotidyltransferase
MVDERSKRIILAVVTAVLPEAKVILYGSRARGDFKPRSDIDIAIDAGVPVDICLIGEIREMLNASNINLGIDVVDLHQVSTAMVANIKQDGVMWKN